MLGVSTAIHRPLAARAPHEHQLARSRPVFFALPACRSRDVNGYHSRVSQAEPGPVEGGQAARRAPAWSSAANETLRPPSCSRARFRRVGLACRARLRVAGVHIVLAAVRGNWLRVSLRGVRLQRRPRLARPNGQCVSHSNLTRDCGSPPSARCTYERTRQVCTRS